MEVKLQQVDGQVRTSIRDTGHGIAEGDLPHIFDRFFIGDASRTHSKKGSGLGLAICKRILDLHQSSIEVTSTPSRGSTFSFDLPLV